MRTFVTNVILLCIASTANVIVHGLIPLTSLPASIFEHTTKAAIVVSNTKTDTRHFSRPEPSALEHGVFNYVNNESVFAGRKLNPESTGALVGTYFLTPEYVRRMKSFRELQEKRKFWRIRCLREEQALLMDEQRMKSFRELQEKRKFWRIRCLREEQVCLMEAQNCDFLPTKRKKEIAEELQTIDTGIHRLIWYRPGFGTESAFRELDAANDAARRTQASLNKIDDELKLRTFTKANIWAAREKVRLERLRNLLRCDIAAAEANCESFRKKFQNKGRSDWYDIQDKCWLVATTDKYS